jgi:2-methylcitrate dehydratase PrpD
LETSFEKLPNSIIEETKKHILDFFACALAGYTLSPSGKIVADLCRSLGLNGEASVIGGDGRKIPAPFATLVNSATGYSLEFDDVSVFSASHPGVTTIPSALAIAEKEGFGGEDLITSVTVGYDLNMRVGAAMSTMGMIRGFMPETSAGVWGATAAAGKLLGLSEEQLLNAFGILAIAPMGAIYEAIKEGAYIKETAPGWSAMTGTFAALLAQRGFTGPHMILEGERGIPCTILQERPDFRRTLKGLGTDFKIVAAAIKPYGCCRILHAPIDATLEIVRERGISPEQVGKVIVQTYTHAAKRYALHKIDKPVHARNSIPYAVAVALVKGKAGADEFSEEGIKDPEVLKFAKRVNVIRTKEMDRLFLAKHRRVARVIVRLKSGQQFSHFVQYPKGEPENPLTDKELETKYRRLAAVTLDKNQIDELLDTVRHLEKVNDVRMLADLMQVQTH